MSWQGPDDRIAPDGPPPKTPKEKEVGITKAQLLIRLKSSMLADELQTLADSDMEEDVVVSEQLLTMIRDTKTIKELWSVMVEMGWDFPSAMYATLMVAVPDLESEDFDGVYAFDWST